MRRKLLYAALVPVLLLGMREVHHRRLVSAHAASPSIAQGSEISQPNSWVAFEADVEVTHPGGRTIIGTFHRASDGSTRLETWAPESPAFRVIDIKSAATSTRYVKDKLGWKSHHLAGTPVRARFRTGPNVTKHSDQVEGFDTYRVTGQSGDTFLRAPELNFFAVLSQDLTTGRREVYKNIKRREQASDLFLPPEDAIVEQKEAAVGSSKAPNP